MADVNVTPLTEQELSQILSGKTDSILLPDKPAEDVIVDEIKNDDTTDINWTKMAEKEPEKDDETEPEKPIDIKDNKPEPVKASGRPPSFVKLINEMVEAKELFGFQEGEVKTEEEAKELIKLNIEEIKKSNQTIDDEAKSFSPQVQAIIEYARNGGQDITPLMSAMHEYEKTSSFNVEDEKGQEGVIKEYLKVQGFDEDYIKEEIETLKDVNKLKDRATKILPKLEQMAQQRLAVMMQDQERAEEAAQKAMETYRKTIHNTLSKETLGDIKLQKQEKTLIWNAITKDDYVSWNGDKTNGFFKRLEELQAGDKSDYDLFLQAVYFVMDPKTFKEKLAEKITTDQAVTTVKKLKLANDRTANASESFEDRNQKQTNLSGRFKRPISF